MLTSREDQIHACVLGNRPALILDIIDHLSEFAPGVVAVYAPSYLVAIVGASVTIANSFCIDDVFSMRLFARLRWEIAAGFYRDPEIKAVLSRTEHPARARFEVLTGDAFGDAWVRALHYDGPSEWRVGLIMENHV